MREFNWNARWELVSVGLIRVREKSNVAKIPSQVIRHSIGIPARDCIYNEHENRFYIKKLVSVFIYDLKIVILELGFQHLMGKASLFHIVFYVAKSS